MLGCGEEELLGQLKAAGQLSCSWLCCPPGAPALSLPPPGPEFLHLYMDRVFGRAHVPAMGLVEAGHTCTSGAVS